MTFEGAEQLKHISGITSVTRVINKRGESNIFTHNPNWNGDNLGTIYIPEAGKTITLNATNLPVYKK